VEDMADTVEDMADTAVGMADTVVGIIGDTITDTSGGISGLVQDGVHGGGGVRATHIIIRTTTIHTIMKSPLLQSLRHMSSRLYGKRKNITGIFALIPRTTIHT